MQGPQGLTGPRGRKGDKGDKGDKCDAGPQGPKGDKGDTGSQGPKGDKGDVGLGGPRGLQGPQGLTGPRDRKGDKGDAVSGFTASGVTMSGNINMGKNKVTNLKTPTNNTDAATKKYVDDREPKFKDGTTATSDVDLRESSGSLTFHDDVTFEAKAKCKDLTVISSSDAIVNKNSLETGHLVGIQSLSTPLTNLLTNSTKHELLVMKGKPTSNTVIYKHPSVNGNPSMTSDVDSVALNISFNSDLPKGIYKYAFDLHFPRSRSIKIFLYGECGGVGYKTTTWYTHWNNNYYQSDESQNNMLGGYFHRGYGNSINFSGEFWHYGDYLTNFGVTDAINDRGIYNHFLKQRVEKISTEPKLLGLSTRSFSKTKRRTLPWI